MRRPRFLSALCLLFLAAPLAADWTRIGPEGGVVTEIAAAPSRPGVVYLGLQRGGVFRSADRGRTWTFAGAGLIDLPVQDLDVDPVNPNAVYASTYQGLFRTTDGGASWSRIGAVELTGPVGGNIAQVEIHPRRPNIVLAAVNGGGLFRSTDRGLTWAAVPGGPENVTALAASPARPGLFWAGLWSGGVRKSTDGGRTWTAAGRGLPAEMAVGAVAADPRAAGTVYASVLGPEESLFKSTNGGDTWKPVRQSPRWGWVRELAVDPGNPAVLYAVADTSVFRSRNGGAAWVKLENPGPLDAPQTVEPLWYGLLAGTPAGVFASRDQGTTWRASQTGLNATLIQTLTLDPQDPPRIYAVHPFSGIFKSRDRGASWLLLGHPFVIEPLGPWTGPLALDPADPETVYAGLPLNIAKSGNGGRRWEAHGVGACFRPTAIGIDPRAPHILYTSGGFLIGRCFLDPNACAIHRSLDAGETWSCIRDGLPRHAGGSLMGIDPFTSEVYALSGTEIWRSADHGSTWTFVDAAVIPFTFTPSPLEEGTLWVGRQGDVGVSRDRGQTWTFSSAGLPADDTVIDLALHPTDPAVLYAATRTHGVFRSEDAGATWTPLGTWPAGLWIAAGIELDPQDPSVVYAGTEAAGVVAYPSRTAFSAARNAL